MDTSIIHSIKTGGSTMTGLLINHNNGTRLCVVCRQQYSPNQPESSDDSNENDFSSYDCPRGCKLDDASEANQHLFYKHFIASEYHATGIE